LGATDIKHALTAGLGVISPELRLPLVALVARGERAFRSLSTFFSTFAVSSSRTCVNHRQSRSVSCEAHAPGEAEAV